jgi:hypothetical protein
MRLGDYPDGADLAVVRCGKCDIVLQFLREAVPRGGPLAMLYMLQKKE